MLGSSSEFMTLIKTDPAKIGTHCVIQRQTLTAKTLPYELCNAMNVAIKVVNFVMRSAIHARFFAALCADLGAILKPSSFTRKSAGCIKESC